MNLIDIFRRRWNRISVINGVFSMVSCLPYFWCSYSIKKFIDESRFISNIKHFIQNHPITRRGDCTDVIILIILATWTARIYRIDEAQEHLMLVSDVIHDGIYLLDLTKKEPAPVDQFSMWVSWALAEKYLKRPKPNPNTYPTLGLNIITENPEQKLRLWLTSMYVKKGNPNIDILKYTSNWR